MPAMMGVFRCQRSQAAGLRGLLELVGEAGQSRTLAAGGLLGGGLKLGRDVCGGRFEFGGIAEGK